MSTQDSSKRVIAYTRHSPRPDETCDSLEVQEARIRAYFKFQGIEVARVIRDPETSARKVPLAERRGGAELLRLTTGRDPEFNVVGACRLDRLFRNVVDGNLTLAQWQDAGVECHLADQGGQSLNTKTAIGRMLVNILLSFASFEPELTAERTSAAMQHKQSNGISMSRYAPFGKRKVLGPPGADGKPVMLLEDDLAQLDVGRRIVGLRTNGHTLTYERIAEILNEDGILSPQGKAWFPSTVHRVERRMRKSFL